MTMASQSLVSGNKLLYDRNSVKSPSSDELLIKQKQDTFSVSSLNLWTEVQAVFAKEKWKRFLCDKKWFLLALIPAAALLWCCFLYIRMTQTPLKSLDISPASDPTSWHFTLADGTEVSPQGENLLLPPDTVLYCSRDLSQLEFSLTPTSILAMNRFGCDAAILSDGKLLADPSLRYHPQEGRFDTGGQPAMYSDIITLGSAQELTLVLSYPGGMASIRQLPSLVLYPDLTAYQSQAMASTAQDALPAGVLLAAALFLAGLFFFQLYHGKADASLLPLSLLALSFGLERTVSYGAYGIWFLQSPLVLVGLQMLPLALSLWALWYHLAGRVRKWGILLPAFGSLSMAIGLVWRLIDNQGGAVWTNLLLSRLLPLALLVSLLLCAHQARRGIAYYRHYFLLGGVLLLLFVLCILFSLAGDGFLWSYVCSLWEDTRMLHSFFFLTRLANHLLLLIFFLLAVYDFVQSIVRRNSELQLLTVQNRYALEHAAYLRRSLDETYAMRHEILHHMNALSALCQEGDLQRAYQYVEHFTGQIRRAPGRYTDHPLINALVSYCQLQAQKLNASFQASVQVPQHIGIVDADLAVLLSNMIDNALHAVAALPNPQERSIQLKVEIFENAGLFVSCTNSFSGGLQRNEHGDFLSPRRREGHGQGIKAMRRVAEQYNSVLIIETQDNLFHVKSYLYFQEGPSQTEG